MNAAPASRNGPLAAALLLIGLCLAPAAPCSSQGSAGNGDQEKIRALLLAISGQILQTQKELRDLSGAPATKGTAERKEELLSQLDQLNQNFDSIATRHNAEELVFEEEEEIDLAREAEELAAPLLHALGDLTKKPRKIEKLKKKIEVLEAQLDKYESASRNLKTLLEKERKRGTAGPEEEKYIRRIKTLSNQYDPDLPRLKLEETRRSLESELTDKKSIFDAAADSARNFFKHRGRSLSITLAVFFGLWWTLNRLRGWIVGERGVFNPSSRTKKILRTGYNILTLGLCVVASLLSLYFLNDWLLLSVVIIVIFAVAWTSRQYIPRFVQEFQLTLNLGTVREHERFVWNGIPWLVKSIGLYATLENERLEGGTMVLPLKELIGKYSRPAVKDEPWFPTSRGDWAILSDGTCGKVERQTQEQVVLWLKGGSLKYYPAAEFLRLAPTNISSGFRYKIEFGLDYSLQSRICDEIPKLFDEGLRRHLAGRFQGDAPDFIRMEVEFDKAASSSLDLEITLDADGRCAGIRDDILRDIHTALVRTCNENGLNIPFNQVTLNLSDDLKLAAKLAGVQSANPQP